MSTRIDRLYGISFILAGVSVALWTVVHPWGTVAGPEVGASGRWLLSHTLHFTGGLFASLGLLAFAPRQLREEVATLERAGFFVAFTGAVLFTGTGVITAFVWPILANHAPALTEASGPIFSPPHPVIGITAVAFSLGFILLSVALLRAGVLSKVGAVAFVIGAALLIPPPPPLSPVPWVLFPVGGVLFGLGFVQLGVAVRSGA